MSLEETVFQWPVHTKLDQVVPYMCAPCMGEKCHVFSFAKLASDFFHTLKNFHLLLFLKGQKAQYLGL